MTAPALHLTVYGTPAPQGSKNRNAAGALYESSAKVRPWRQDVKTAALDALLHDEAWVALSGAVWLDVQFSLRRPKHHFGTGKNAGLLKASAPPYPTGTPDLDKLVRSTQDALKDAGVLADDSVVATLSASKVYVLWGDSLRTPGAVIKVWRLTDFLKEPTP
ncbi:RusA family crossover junction endodeoxyribonuclease [Streptomyces sp. 3214.6]|uniref:RusA family crossover junction endodeoxyribonuclease n=1 Tax=Streptomyces sp. 3214.6 TaxID=1882757 RepID=UPI00090B66EF|nr:RusA family crossover junction endodeoxyribonuclease [Streptomyces sp. 3214.6]SHI65500.1 crossover junction endodeoxyribonuclease RusA [Streptomyces sp. 3214.6]